MIQRSRLMAAIFTKRRTPVMTTLSSPSRSLPCQPQHRQHLGRHIDDPHLPSSCPRRLPLFQRWLHCFHSHNRDPKLWDATDVLRWLKENGLDAFSRKFYANGFEGPQLLALNGSAFRVGSHVFLLMCQDHGFDQQQCDALDQAIQQLRMSIRVQ